MRILGSVSHDADTTTTVPMLTRAGLLQPEIMMNVMNLFESNYTAFSSLLARKGLTSKGLYSGLDTGDFRVVGNRKVQWPIKGYPIRKGVIVSAPAGDTPGLNGAAISLVINTDFFSVNDSLELVDRRTLLHVLSKTKTGDNAWTYSVVLKYNQVGSFIDPTLIAVGKEIGFGHTSFPELSEDGGEKTTYHEWHTEWMNIQRMKYTISGSAKHHKLWIEHRGKRMWDYAQNIEMMQRWALAQEHYNIFGRATVDANDKVYLKDLSSRDVISGNGIRAQGDSSMKYQYNTLSIQMLERVMSDIQLMSNTSEGVQEVAVIGGQTFHNNFQRLMRDVLQQNPVPLYERAKDGDGIRTAFSWYEFGGVRLNVVRSPYFDAPYRPIERDSLGNSNFSENAMFVSLGNTIGGMPNVQLTTLGNEEGDRRFVLKMINGMAGNGPSVSNGATGRIELASSPVDGMQVHVLSESGVIMRNPFGFAELIKTRHR